MSFLGGVRWADLSSDTQSLSAAPPFCPDLDNDLPASTLPGAALSPRSPALCGQGRKNRGQKNAADTAEALLLQCDAAAEQSYLNPSCAADLGCSNAGINLHFKEAARLGSTTPVDEDMGEAEDLLGTPHVREDAAHGSTQAALHGPTAVSAMERRRGQKLKNDTLLGRGGHASFTTNNQRGSGYVSGGGSSCAGFKGLLASTNGAPAVSGGATACNRKKRGDSDTFGRNGSGSCAAVPRQHSGASQGKKPGREKAQERAESQRSIATSWPPPRKSGGDHMRAGDSRGGAYCSNGAPAATVHVHQNVCQNEEISPGGERKTGEATERRRNLAKDDQLHPVSGGAEGGTKAQADPGPDASDNWRSSPSKEPGGVPTAALPDESAPRLCSDTATDTVSGHASQPDHRSDFSGVCGHEISDKKVQSEEPLRSDGTAHKRSPETLVRYNRSQETRQRRTPVSVDVRARECREKAGRRRLPLATRMMTPAKRHRPYAGGEGQDESAASLHSNAMSDTGRPRPAPADENYASGDIEEGGEDTRAVENVSVLEGNRRRASPGLMEHSPAKPAEDYNASQATSARTSETAAAGLEGGTASFSQSQVLHGPPPRKKKRAETEMSKRLSVEDMAVARVSSQSGDTAAAAGASAASIPEAVPFTRTSSKDIFSCDAQQHRRGKRNSLRGTNSAATTRGRRRSKAVGDGTTGERTAHENDGVHRFPGSPRKSVESTTGGTIACPSLLQVAAQACPLLQLPGACFATPPYIMVPVAAATPLTTLRRSSNASVVPPAVVHPSSVVCGSTVDKKKPRQPQQHKSATAMATPRQTTVAAVAHEDDEETEQEWARRASARMKDIAVGKATEGYKNFIRIVPKDHRRAGDPATPDPKQRCSKAKFQRELLDWRKQLHRYDGCCPTEEHYIPPDSSCSGGGAAAGWPNASIPRSISPSLVQSYRDEEHCDTRTHKEGNCNVLRGRNSAAESFGPAPFFFTPTGGFGQQGAGETAKEEAHPDPIEEFNRECERTWL